MLNLPRRFVLAGLAVAGLAGAVPTAATAAPQVPSPEMAFSERSLGDPDAPVELIEYVSLTCPHCADFHKSVLPKLKEAYIDTGKLHYVLRDFPLDQAAAAGALMARCAPRPRYFGLIDLMFERQRDWSQADNPVTALTRLGRQVGLSRDKAQACMEDESLRKALVKRMQQANKQHNVEGTPTLVLNGEKIPNSGYDDLAGRIDAALEDAGATP